MLNQELKRGRRKGGRNNSNDNNNCNLVEGVGWKEMNRYQQRQQGETEKITGRKARKHIV